MDDALTMRVSAMRPVKAFLCRMFTSALLAANANSVARKIRFSPHLLRDQRSDSTSVEHVSSHELFGPGILPPHRKQVKTDFRDFP